MVLLKSNTNKLLPVLIAAIVLLAPLFSDSQAYAQACCGSTQSTSLGRLGAGQRYLIGLEFQYRNYYGNFEGGTFKSNDGTILELRETVFGTIGLGRSLQLGMAAPLVQNHKNFGNLSEWGSGLSDIALSMRYELVQTGLYRRLPGTGLTLSAKLPTGRSIFESMHRGQSILQTDVTGTGSYDLGAGLQLEWTMGGAFLSLNPTIQYALPFTNEQGFRVQRGVLYGGTLSAGYAFYAPWIAEQFLYLSTALALEQSRGLQLDGTWLVQGVERRASATLQLGGYAVENLYTGIRFGIDLPVDGLGANLLAAWQVGLVLRRVFYE